MSEISPRAWAIAVWRDVRDQLESSNEDRLSAIVREGAGRRWYEISGWVSDGEARQVQDELDRAARRA